MDSDSDSDGSHISATPPRHSPPPSPTPLPPAVPPPRPSCPSTTRSRTKIKAADPTNSRPVLKLKLSTKHLKPITEPDPKPPIIDSFRSHPQIPPPNFSNLPFQIHTSTHHQNYHNASDTLLPGSHCLSKFASFSNKGQNKNLIFEPSEKDFPTETKSEIHVQNADLVKVKNEAASQRISSKKVSKHLNLIGVNVSSTKNVNKPKRVSEGNFVKLNINGYGRKKFAFKNKRKSFSAYSGRRKFSRYYKKKSRVGNEGKESGEILDEEGLVLEIGEREESMDFDSESIEEAVMSVRKEASDGNLEKLLKFTHGYDSFRNGQLEAIKMVLSGKSTMLVLPTGSGKSLCYQLPALILPGVTLVVSPLVALMIDQLKQLPPAIPGGLLCSSQMPEEAAKTLRSLQEGAIKVLFVSPERFLNAEFLSIFSGSQLVSLVVVDEAHCVSEWSHNFRPSYMRLRASLLCGKLNAGCILAMTATATTKTLHDVMHALEITPTNLIQSAQLRDNLHLSVSVSGNRMKDLVALLKSSPFLEIKSLIIYCKFQYETDMISKYLCDNNISAKSYHSAIPAKDRNRVQELFCSNRIRVVVATVAFGMGLDKSDVGAVIHYSLPESLEEYVQEIGRAGRDGRFSYCHLLFDDVTYFKLRSLMYSDGVDAHAVNLLLSHVFMSKGSAANDTCSLVKETASRKFDMKEEVMLTILTQLELGEVQYLQLLPQINVTCTVNFHKTPPALFAAKDIVVASILNKSEMKDGQYVFDIPSVANSIRMQAVDLTNHLQSLKLKGEITYDLKDPAYCYTIINVPEDICSLAASLTKWLSEVETCKVRKIDAMFNAAVFAAKECDKVQSCQENQHTSCLQRKIQQYFNGDDDVDVPNQMGQNSPFLRADIKVFLQSNSQVKFTPRAIARILHGLASPAFPAAIWSRTHFWGRYQQIDFKVVMEAAKGELISMVGKDVI
ncbi:ATP-dependent DNA helicase Q-like 5 [Olea europaea var. sylvestris]|uniref:ATP-dependent DNA helicase Q-like 5 n=1 Tax=Olea europaea var. sylvestris TaxID=158386 RepID=UPI000C1D4DAF|nr:ATP-dependent DNA helicase Q-like 5 [Olea europaea var. sylvestris]XP_022885575.1 ATP-dependent DNA helicase Q-like 5 [Olea europaea var. sylvestris]XP_022885585.1 ATP-dependent DNA helicase Q-like 5 [Olea europaea var. sylvestris]